jgi:hypothetical protein
MRKTIYISKGTEKLSSSWLADSGYPEPDLTGRRLHRS